MKVKELVRFLGTITQEDEVIIVSPRGKMHHPVVVEAAWLACGCGSCIACKLARKLPGADPGARQVYLVGGEETDGA